jgi:hypothetical protein
VRVRAAWLIEGVRLEEPLRMGPLHLSPVPLDRGYFGREAREIFNAELADAGFVTAVSRPIWGAQIAPYRRLVRAVSDELALEDASQLAILNAAAAKAADALAVIWGGAPEVIAGATELWDEARGWWRNLSLSVGGGAWHSSILRKVLPVGVVLDDDDPGELWAASGTDPRIALWLSLFRGLSRDRDWDRRMFRACSLLETVGSEVAPRRVAVTDRDGKALHDREGRPATTKDSRGKSTGPYSVRWWRSICLTPSSWLTHRRLCGPTLAFGSMCGMLSHTRVTGRRRRSRRVAGVGATKSPRHSHLQGAAAALTPGGPDTQTAAAPPSRPC